jgi:hypothetical protein
MFKAPGNTASAKGGKASRFLRERVSVDQYPLEQSCRPPVSWTTALFPPHSPGALANRTLSSPLSETPHCGAHCSKEISRVVVPYTRTVQDFNETILQTRDKTKTASTKFSGTSQNFNPIYSTTMCKKINRGIKPTGAFHSSAT